MDTHSPKFDLVTLNPPMVIGSWLPGYTRPNDSSIVVRNYMSGVAKVAAGGMGWVDVHDVAQAHIATAMQPKGHAVLSFSLPYRAFPDNQDRGAFTHPASCSSPPPSRLP